MVKKNASNSSLKNGVYLENLTQKHGDKEVLSNANISFNRGRLSLIFAQNSNANKALFNTIAGHEKADKGDVYIQGLSLNLNKETAMNHVFYVSAQVPLHFAWSLDKTAEALSLYYPNWNHSSFFYWLRNFNLLGSQKYSELSEKSRRQALLAMALSCQADVILIDNIEEFVDAAQLGDIYTSLNQRALQGASILITSTKLSHWIDKNVDIYRIKDANIKQVDMKDLKYRLWLKAKQKDSRVNYWTPQFADNKDGITQTHTHTSI